MDKRNRILLFLLALPLLFASLLTDGCAGNSIGGNAGPYDIIFESISDVSTGQIGIYGIDADGTGLILITDYGYSPTLSPNGTRIAFSSKRDGNWEIYVMDAYGEGQSNITNNAVRDGAPAWSPVSR
jgi:hypothetical protein